MTPTSVDRVVEEYLRRLESAAAALSPADREDLLTEIRAHIDAARNEGADNEVAIRTLLDRLGTPEEIVAAAAPAAAVPVIRRPGTTLELVAVLLMTVGSFIPFVGWTTGVVCMWISQRWRIWEKLLGTLVFPFGPFWALWLGGLFALRTGTSRSCTSDSVTRVQVCSGSGADVFGWVLFAAWIVGVVAPIVVAVWLYRRARRRAEEILVSY